MRAFKVLVVFSCLFLLVACGGGGGGGNTVPVANAGVDQSVVLGRTVTLNASNSSDPDGDLLTYSWRVTEQPQSNFPVVLSDYSIVNPTYTAMTVGNFVFELSVSDGSTTAIDYVTITVSDQNAPPVANAGSDQNVATGDTVFLDGRGSSDDDGDVLTYNWYIALSPVCSFTTLSGATSDRPQFFADCDGVYTVKLQVHDGENGSLHDTVIITAATPNSAPVANAGADQNIERYASNNTVVTLNGNGSNDADSDPLTYSWVFTSIPQGSTATLSDPTLVNPTFTADVDGAYVLALTVDDGELSSTVDTVTINVATVNAIPVADAGDNQSVVVGDIVMLDGSESSDIDADLLSYTWELTSIPAGSTAILSDPTAVNPQFTADLKGSYVLTLIVNDGEDDSTSDVITVVATDPIEVDFGITTGLVADLCVFNGDIGIDSYTWHFNNCDIYGYPGNKLFLRVTNNTNQSITVTQVSVVFLYGLDWTISISPGSEIVYPGTSPSYALYVDTFRQINGSTVTVSFDGLNDLSADWKLNLNN